MMQKHFIFQPGEWLGEGTIRFSNSDEEIAYHTKWTVQNADGDTITCYQRVEMQGSQDFVDNTFTFSHLTPQKFQISLSNLMLEGVEGTGIIDEEIFSWEFRSHPYFEGFEVYTLEENGDYAVHAEYASPDQFRTIINGRIWKKE